MKHNSSNRRSRNRNNRGRNNNNGRSQVFDSNGPEVRIRGTAHQIFEKYTALAKDARSSGDSVLAESYLQHAEHYQRLILSFEPEQPAKQEEPAPEQPAQEEASNDDDLGLPASIIGGGVTSDSQEQEKALENA